MGLRWGGRGRRGRRRRRAMVVWWRRHVRQRRDRRRGRRCRRNGDHGWVRRRRRRRRRVRWRAWRKGRARRRRRRPADRVLADGGECVVRGEHDPLRVTRVVASGALPVAAVAVRDLRLALQSVIVRRRRDASNRPADARVDSDLADRVDNDVRRLVVERDVVVAVANVAEVGAASAWECEGRAVRQPGSQAASRSA